MRLDILTRYGANSLADLESKIAHGDIVEHPAWEDLIVAENLGVRLEELDAYLDRLQERCYRSRCVSSPTLLFTPR